MRRLDLPPRKSSSIRIITANRPPCSLIDDVCHSGIPVIVVDDGSGPEYRSVFHEVSCVPEVTLLRHAVPLGRAAAVRTAINHVLCDCPQIRRIVIDDLEIPRHLFGAILRVHPFLFLYSAWMRFSAALPWTTLLVLLVLIGVEIHGFSTSRLFDQRIWNPEGQARLIQFAGLYAAASAAILILAPWLFAAMAGGLLLLMTLVLLPKAVLAVGFLLFSAWCLGDLLSGLEGVPSTMVGLAVYVAAMPLVARIPIHYPLVYAIVLAIPIAIRRPRPRLPELPALSTWSERAGFAALMFVFTIHWFAMLKPEAGADGLAMHLAIPMNIAQHHMLTYEPSRFVWAVMPMGSDLAYTIAYLLGGEHAARLLNLTLLALLLVLLHHAIRKWSPPPAIWLLLALFAATPIVHLVTGELMAENLLAALLLAGLLAVWRRAFIPAAILAGAAISTKLGALPVVALLLVCAAMERPRRRSVPALALLIVTAAPPYAIAWTKTRNPIFPFLNERFHSPLLPRHADLRDKRFRKPLTWQTPYNLTFRSNMYWEGQNGSFGFQYLVLAPLALAGALAVRRRTIVGATLVALAAAFLVLRSDPNARYLYPELPLLTIPFAALLGWSSIHQRWLQRSLLTFAVVALALDVWFLPSSSYYHKDLYGPFTDAQRHEYLATTAPVRLAIEWVERTHPGAPVLLTHDTGVAGLSGEAYENQWHQYTTLDRIRNAPDTSAVRRLLDDWNVRFLIVRRPGAGRTLRPQTLRDLIANCSIPEFAVSDLFVARLEDNCSTASVPDVPSQPKLIAGEGEFDDFDPTLLYRGEWEHSAEFDGPSGHTVSFSDAPGAQVSFAFEGTEVAWVFTRAVNRGIASVSIDGRFQGEVDLYGAKTKWQERTVFSGLPSRKHLLVIQVTGRHHEGAEGAYIDVDHLEVR